MRLLDSYLGIGVLDLTYVSDVSFLGFTNESLQDFKDAWD
jgi:hypothetical protein